MGNTPEPFPYDVSEDEDELSEYGSSDGTGSVSDVHSAHANNSQTSVLDASTEIKSAPDALNVDPFIADTLAANGDGDDNKDPLLYRGEVASKETPANTASNAAKGTADILSDVTLATEYAISDLPLWMFNRNVVSGFDVHVFHLGEPDCKTLGLPEGASFTEKKAAWIRIHLCDEPTPILAHEDMLLNGEDIIAKYAILSPARAIGDNDGVDVDTDTFNSNGHDDYITDNAIVGEEATSAVSANIKYVADTPAVGRQSVAQPGLEEKHTIDASDDGAFDVDAPGIETLEDLVDKGTRVQLNSAVLADMKNTNAPAETPGASASKEPVVEHVAKDSHKRARSGGSQMAEASTSSPKRKDRSGPRKYSVAKSKGGRQLGLGTRWAKKN